jgi:hypothetical protein
MTSTLTITSPRRLNPQDNKYTCLDRSSNLTRPGSKHEELSLAPTCSLRIEQKQSGFWWTPSPALRIRRGLSYLLVYGLIFIDSWVKISFWWAQMTYSVNWEKFSTMALDGWWKRRSWLILLYRYIKTICTKDSRRPRNTSVNVSGLRTENKVRDILNTKHVRKPLKRNVR